MAMTPLAAAEAERLPLWHGKAPVGAPGSTETEAADAFITVHLPEGTPEGTSTPAVVICPGGGYGGLVTGAEGHGIAAWLNEHGIAGIVHHRSGECRGVADRSTEGGDHRIFCRWPPRLDRRHPFRRW
jgi:hypothetical protein